MDQRQHSIMPGIYPSAPGIYPSAPPMRLFTVTQMNDIQRLEAQLPRTKSRDKQRCPDVLTIFLIVSLVVNAGLTSCVSLYVYVNYQDNNVNTGQLGQTSPYSKSFTDRGWPCQKDLSEAVCLACSNFREYDFWHGRVRKIIIGNKEMCCAKTTNSLPVLSNLILNSKKRLSHPVKSEAVDWQFTEMNKSQIEGRRVIVPLLDKNNHIQINKTGLYHVMFLSTLKRRMDEEESQIKVQVIKENNNGIEVIMEQNKAFVRPRTEESFAFQTISLQNTFRMTNGDKLYVIVSDARKLYKMDKTTWLGVYQL